jgi:hypothetical protein
MMDRKKLVTRWYFFMAVWIVIMLRMSTAQGGFGGLAAIGGCCE